MSPPHALTAAEQYDRALRYAKRVRHLPAHKRPKPTSAWPPENVALLEHYREWLISGGASLQVIHMLYLPMAGYVLSFNLKPYTELNLEADFRPALDYVLAKDTSAEWNKNRRNALDKFRLFLRQTQGRWSPILRPPPDWAAYVKGLPDWLVVALERYYHLMRSHWRPARSHLQTLNFWQSHTRVWRWLCDHQTFNTVVEVKRQWVMDFVDHGLTHGYAASTLNNWLRCFRLVLLFLQDQEVRVPQALLRLPTLKVPDRLPRFLTDDQVRRVRDEMERQVAETRLTADRRDACLNRAAFYLLWQCGLRLGEVEELRLEDLDLLEKKLMIRQGKGQKDRAVYLADQAVRGLQAYLSVRGLGPTDHVFLYRNQAVCKDLLRSRLKAVGERVGVKVTPHQLRHTCATQLLNAGCRVTSIQKLLGHRSLDTTMIYARVHDRSLADDYYAAMERIEQALDVSGEANESQPATKQAQLLELVSQLAEPHLENEMRLELVAQLRGVLA